MPGTIRHAKVPSVDRGLCWRPQLLHSRGRNTLQAHGAPKVTPWGVGEKSVPLGVHPTPQHKFLIRDAPSKT